MSTWSVETGIHTESASCLCVLSVCVCVQGLELAMQRVKGVVGTRVGYTQGHKESPTYTQVCSGQIGGLDPRVCHILYNISYIIIT